MNGTRTRPSLWKTLGYRSFLSTQGRSVNYARTPTSTRSDPRGPKEVPDRCGVGQVPGPRAITLVDSWGPTPGRDPHGVTTYVWTKRCHPRHLRGCRDVSPFSVLVRASHSDSSVCDDPGLRSDCGGSWGQGRERGSSWSVDQTYSLEGSQLYKGLFGSTSPPFPTSTPLRLKQLNPTGHVFSEREVEQDDGR